jgi:hypothetical protein
MPEPALKQVIERHRMKLLAIPGVTGIAGGRTTAGEAGAGGPCIVVYGTLSDPPAGLPDALEGYPVEFRRTGAFRAKPPGSG